MGGEDRDSAAGEGAGKEAPASFGPGDGDSELPASGLELPSQSPLFHAFQSARYERQRLIQAYQQMFSCCLIVMIDEVFPQSVGYLEDLIYDASTEEDLHLILASPGGDGETAIRLIRSMQARCRELSVIIPDQAKSAATLMTLGAHHILMGPTSDLGPIDPQLRIASPTGPTLAAAKDIVSAVDLAIEAVAAAPETYTLHASLLASVDALLVQAARSAIARTADLLREALSACTQRTNIEIGALSQSLAEPLIDAPKSHAAVFGGHDAKSAGLPVIELDYTGEQWQIIWRLYMKYMTTPNGGIYEGAYASHVLVPAVP